MISAIAFKEAMNLLALVYNTQQEKAVLTSEKLIENWYKYFCDCFNSDKRFLEAVTHYTNVSKFFPRVPGEIVELWQKSGLDKSPYLTGVEVPHTLANHQLPDGRAKELEEIESLTEEQQAENAYRIKLLLVFGLKYKGDDKQKMLDYLRNCSIDEAIAVVKGLKKVVDSSLKSPRRRL